MKSKLKTLFLSLCMIALSACSSYDTPPNAKNLNETGDYKIYLRAVTPEGCKFYSVHNTYGADRVLVICPAGFSAAVSE